MGIRPNKPASVASATEIRRAASMSQEELAQSAPFASIDPASIPEMKVWLRVDQATDSGTLTIPDAMGGSPAVQATAARKPALGTTGNGLAKLTNAADKFMSLPLSTGINHADYFAFGFWFRPTIIASGGGEILAVGSAASGQAAQDRINVRQALNDLTCFTWVPPSGAFTRSSRTQSGVLQLNIWKFISYEYHGVLPTEATRSVFKDMGTPLTSQQAETYTPAQGGTADTPSTMVVTTGSMTLFSRGTGAVNGLVGDIGPDIFFYDPRTMTDTKRVQLAQYRVPLG